MNYPYEGTYVQGPYVTDVRLVRLNYSYKGLVHLNYPYKGTYVQDTYVTDIYVSTRVRMSLMRVRTQLCTYPFFVGTEHT